MEFVHRIQEFIVNIFDKISNYLLDPKIGGIVIFLLILGVVINYFNKN